MRRELKVLRQHPARDSPDRNESHEERIERPHAFGVDPSGQAQESHEERIESFFSPYFRGMVDVVRIS